MPIEATYLAWAVLLGLIQLSLAAAGNLGQRGPKWAAGPRDAPAPELSGVAGRLGRCWRNFLETFPFFAALVLLLLVLERGNELSAWGAALYFWARVAYVPAYASGIPHLRSLIWGVSMVGIVMLLPALL